MKVFIAQLCPALCEPVDGSQVTQKVKTPPAIQGDPGFDPWVGKIPLKEEMETHSSIVAWEIPWIEEPGRL